MSGPDIKIAVATHKPYRMPSDPVYLPIQVGAALHPDLDFGFQKDDEGDNISNRNPFYCELTALWWLWKNCDARYKGLVHYRRHFRTLDRSMSCSSDRFQRIATAGDYKALIKTGAEIVLPKKRNYYIETVYSHYDHTFDGRQFDIAHNVLVHRCPEFVPAWDKLMAGRRAYLYNMFVMRSDLVDKYCTWLFPLLADLENMIDSSSMDAFQARWIGRVAERFLNVWVETKGLNVAELATLSPEPVDWLSKGRGFLAAKFLGKKYERSF